jgi:lactate permease
MLSRIRDLGLLSANISLFLPVVSTGLALGMLWVAEGTKGVKQGFVPAIVAGLTLGLSAIVFVRLLPYIGIQFVQLVGVFSGLMAIIALFTLRLISGKPIFARADKKLATDGAAMMPLWKAVLPWALLVAFCIIISIPFISTALHDIPGGLNKVYLYTNKVIDLKVLNQAYFWVLVSTALAAPFLIRSKGEAKQVLKTWARRAWSPTLAAAVFFAIAYVMDYSAQSAIDGSLAFAAGAMDLNMNAVIGLSLAAFFGATAFPAVSPLLGLFGCFVSGSEASSNVMFHGILKKSTGVLDLDFMKVYAAHAVSGGIASGISPAKIVNAAAVIDRLGIEGEVIRKSAVVSIILTIIVGAILFAWIAL